MVSNKLSFVSEEKPWQIEAVLRLAATLMLGLAAFSLGGLLLTEYLPETVEGHLSPVNLIFSTVSFQGLVLALVHFFLRQHAMSWGEFIGIRSSHWRRAVWLGLLIGWGALPPALALKKLAAGAMTWFSLSPKEQAPVEILQKATDWQPFLGFGLTAIVLAPLVEEILFRGILYSFLKQRGFPVLAGWISAVLFAAIHANQVTFIPLVFLALCLVWVYEYSGNLLAPIMAHAFFNSVNFLVLLWQVVFHIGPNIGPVSP
jgi:membrane protease YdiL (CAAX protease family)